MYLGCAEGSHIPSESWTGQWRTWWGGCCTYLTVQHLEGLERRASGSGDLIQASIHQVEPKSLRNNYYGGISAWYEGNYSKAERYFSTAVNEAQSLALSEVDVADFFRRESQRSLEAARKKLQG